MKLALLSYYSNQSPKRGVEVWVDELSSRLTKTISCVIITSSKHFVPKSPQTRLTIVRRAFLDKESLMVGLFTLLSLPRLWKERVDVVIPTNGGWQTAIIRLFTWVIGAKMVVVGHAGKGWDDANNALCFPDVFVALSEFAAHWVSKVNPFISVEVIPNGVDTRRFSSTGTTLPLAVKHPRVLVVGALSEGKRIDLAINAVKRLKAASLVIAGSGPLEQQLKTLAKQKLGNRCIFVKVENSKMPALYRSCDVFTASFWPSEAFGLVLLEALSCGLPIVVTDDPVRREIVGNKGILVDTSNIDLYSKSLRRAIQMKNHGFDKSRDNDLSTFDWTIVANRYSNLLNRITASNY